MKGPKGLQRSHATALLVSALAVSGVVCVAQGLWIPTKAWASQQLIARAWRDVGPERPEVKPWPWADTWPVAKLWLPGTDRPLYVLAGASGQSLAFGPAHVSASARPGERDNVALAGHRDTHFAPLARVVAGDEIEMETLGGSTRYRVYTTAVVHESRVDLLDRTGRHELTLITCHPFDAIVPGGPMRFVVRAAAVEPSYRAPGSALPARSSRPADSRR